MVRDLLIRGMLAGVIAGSLAFGVAKVFGEPQIDRAIAFEEQHAETVQQQVELAAADQQTTKAAHEHGQGDQEEELVSRAVQSTTGLLTAVVVFGAAMGGLFALTFAFAYGRLGPLSPRALAALLAAGGFLAIYLVPSLKYPANPPAVGDADTIGLRTGLYFLMIIVSLGALTLSVSIGRRLAERHGLWNATLIAGAAFVGAVVLAQVLLPDVNEVPADFPAVVLWKFRMASLGLQALMWAALGLLFGWLAERRLKPAPGRPAGSLRPA